MTTTIYQSSTLEKRKNNWKRKAQMKHNFFYQYPFMDDYINNSTYIRMLCPIHGIFKDSPSHHTYGRGCNICELESKRLLWRLEFIEKSRKIHGNRYDYSKVVFINANTRVEIICKIHGSFWQTPSKHYNASRGCHECGDIQRAKSYTKTTGQFIKEAMYVHGDRYDYSLVDYKGAHIYVKIICPIHGVFDITPSSHLSQNAGCSSCSTHSYSKVSMKWLESFNNPNIQHALNGGEYKIIKSDGTFYKADGYDKETNTVYEFHGDVWHGNPKLFLHEDRCHPFNKDITAKELYDKTIEREEDIKSLGYNLVVMWQSDFIRI